MPNLPILRYPHPVLKKVCRRVENIDNLILSLVDDLLDTMHAGPGSVGVAAPQIGVILRVCVVDVSASRQGKENNHGRLCMINPEIVWVSDEKEKGWEGCLSIPGLRGLVPRHRRIGIRYLTWAGEMREEEYEDFLARIFQHESELQSDLPVGSFS